MKRWERVNLDPAAIAQIVKNDCETIPTIEGFEPDGDQDAQRSIAVLEYAGFAVMHHMQAEGEPGRDGMSIARRGAALALEYFFGSWRQTYNQAPWSEEPVALWDAAKCRKELSWFDAWRKGLFCACVAEDQGVLRELWKWPDIDLRYDEGCWDSPQQENDFHILLALTMRQEKPAEQQKLRKRITASHRRLAKLWLGGLDTALAADAPGLLKALELLLAYNLKSEFAPNNPMRAVLLEGSIIWSLARQTMVSLPDLPEMLSDRIVRRETLQPRN